MENWLEGQRKHRLLLERLLDNYNEGRSMSFYCLAVALMPPELIDKAINELKGKIAVGQIDSSDVKSQAKEIRGIIQRLAQESGIGLKPKKEVR